MFFKSFKPLVFSFYKYRLLFLLFSISSASAQKEANIWYFGYNAGIDFNSGQAVAITDGALHTDEGCASVADQNGNLLFYTDGLKVYNKNHQLMPNGSGLMGNVSSTQSSVVVPQPGSGTVYYIFTVDASGGSNGFRYSTVDLSLQGGLGDIVMKNVALYSPSCEKVTAVLHANQKDFWVISHQFNSSNFVAYQLSSSGLNSNSIISTIGSAHSGLSENTRGYLKVSPDGTKIAVACDVCNFVEIFDFDKSSGRLSNPIKLTYSKPYGLEFSPDNHFLYVGSWGGPGFIVQLDMQKTNATDLKASEVEVAKGNRPYSINALQLGPDGVIYISVLKSYLSAIVKPNVKGTACDFRDNYLDLKGKTSVYGLPTYIQSFFNVPLVTISNRCLGHQTLFTLSHNDYDSVRWNFGDPNSGSLNTSKLSTPGHKFTDSGTYTVTCIIIKGLNRDTSRHQVYIRSLKFSLGNDTMLCPGNTILLKVPAWADSVLWRDGSNLKQYTVIDAGLTWAEVREGDCFYRDSIRVNKPLDLPPLNLGNDTVLCEKETLTLDIKTSIPNIIYLWQDGNTNSTYTINKPGLYIASYRWDICKAVDSMRVSYKPIPYLKLIKDSILCGGETLEIGLSNNPLINYVWNDGSKQSNYLVSQPGLYWCQIDSNGCTTRDSVEITYIPSNAVELGPNIKRCEGDSVVFHLTGLADTYLWQDLSTASMYKTKHSGKVSVSARKGKCTVQDSVFVEFIDCNCFVYIPNAFTPQDDGLNDGFQARVNCPVSEFKLTVFNRWGEIVFESNQPDAPWDGTFNGQLVEQDIYMYQMSFRYFLNNELKIYRGSLHVLN